MTKDIVLVGVTVVYIDNILRPFQRRISNQPVTRGTVYDYIEEELTGKMVYLNGLPCTEPMSIYPKAGDIVAVTPYVAGFLGNLLGFVASIALGGLVGGLVRGLAWGGIVGTIGKSLVYGALMYVGGKVINSVFKLNQPSKDRHIESSYGWELPRLCSTEGMPIGETYGECIPTPQLLMSHVDTVHEGNKDVQYLNLLLCGGWGIVDDIYRIRIGYTPIEHFKDVQIETRPGQNDQKPISFFPDTVQDTRVDLEMDTGTPLVRSTDSHKAERIDITVEAPQGIYHMENNGDLSACSVTFYAAYRRMETDGTATGTWIQGGAWSIGGNSTSAVRQTYTVADKLPPGRYAVKLTTTARSHSTRDSTYVTWSMLTAYQYDGAKVHPGKVLVGLRIKATGQLSGGLPDVNWKQRRMLVWVYDWDKKQYVQKSARNPVWAAYDILHHCRRLKDIRTGKLVYVVEGCRKECFSQYWAQWVCAANYADERVSDGKGGTEARFSFDAYFNGTGTRWDAASKAAATAHAALLRYGTQYGITVDRPGVMCQIFGEGQILKDSFSGSFASAKERARAVEITYTDRQNDYKNTLIKLYSPAYATDLSLPDNTAKVTLFGVSGRSQAYREGMYYLATNERQRQSVSFEVDVAGLACQYGDIIGVSHTAAQLGAASGRVVKVATDEIRLDKEVSNVQDRYYTLTVIHGTDGGLVTRKVKADLTGAWIPTPAYTEADMPSPYDSYILSESSQEIKPYRITKITQSGEHAITLTAIEYDASIYNTDWSRYPTIAYAPLPRTLRAPGLLEAIDDMTGGEKRNVHISWSMPKGTLAVEQYVVYYRRGQDTTWTYYATTPEMRITLKGLAPFTQYYIRVCAMADGFTSDYAQCSVVTKEKKENIETVAIHDVKPAVLARRGTRGRIHFDLHVRWQPTTVSGAVYYRMNASEWLCAGEGIGQMIIPMVTVGATYEIAVIHQGSVKKPDARITVTGVQAAPGAPKAVTTTFEAIGEIPMQVTKWEAADGDIDFYELRSSGEPGSNGYCGRTTDIYFKDENILGAPNDGMIYVYAHDIWGQWSAAGSASYHIIRPKAPIVMIREEIGGLRITLKRAEGEHAVCIRGTIKIDNKRYTAGYKELRRGVFIPLPPKVYSVEARWWTYNNAGEHSEPVLATVRKTIDPALIGEETITLSKIDKAVQGEIAKATIARQEVTRVVGDLEGLKKDQYTAISQLKDAIGLKVSKGDIKSEVALGLQGVTLSGKQVHITGDTVIDKDVITKGMIQAGAITGDKLDVKDLSSITANIGVLRTKSTGARMEIRDNCILIYDDNNNLRVRMGVWNE